ncbi:vWA domain-containing protein [Paenibacillus gansuensis]|uniref:VWA domain-containing protein n=1 Tax=Paenibacillus gansuensis TaxID=306542 RepID=A0ABW5P7M9_9BACL
MRKQRFIFFAVFLCACLAAMPACSSGGRNDKSNSAGNTAESAPSKSSSDTSGKDDAAGGAGESKGEETGTGSGPARGGGGGSTGSPGGKPAQDIPAGQLTAGEWNDLREWKRWKLQLQESDWGNAEQYWGFYTAQRLTVLVTYQNKPVPDAEVILSDSRQGPVWKARTDRKGQAELFAAPFDPQGQGGPYRITAESGQDTRVVENVEFERQEPLKVELRNEPEATDSLDVLFAVDTTGSMGDELEYLEAELKNVVQRIEQENNQKLDMRISSNFYRDIQDSYTIKDFPFTRSIDEVVEQFSAQSAAGGGDYPEAVELALDNAVNEHDWSDHARARLLFLVLDAPPRHKPETIEKVKKVIQQAAAKGIRIIPVVSSGIDSDTEYILRTFGIYTGGTYVFLTDHSGIGSDHKEAEVGEFQVEYLNDLLVNIVNGYVK